MKNSNTNHFQSTAVINKLQRALGHVQVSPRLDCGLCGPACRCGSPSRSEAYDEKALKANDNCKEDEEEDGGDFCGHGRVGMDEFAEYHRCLANEHMDYLYNDGFYYYRGLGNIVQS